MDEKPSFPKSVEKYSSRYMQVATLASALIPVDADQLLGMGGIVNGNTIPTIKAAYDKLVDINDRASKPLSFRINYVIETEAGVFEAGFLVTEPSELGNRVIKLVMSNMPEPVTVEIGGIQRNYVFNDYSGDPKVNANVELHAETLAWIDSFLAG